jgi:hypothetical protein
MNRQSQRWTPKMLRSVESERRGMDYRRKQGRGRRGRGDAV